MREVEYGLEVLCGGVASEPVELWREEQRALMPGGASPDGLWQMLCEKIYTNHALGAEWCSRPDPSRPAQPRGESFGINSDQPYCMVTANEFRGAGKMIKVRAAAGASARAGCVLLGRERGVARAGRGGVRGWWAGWPCCVLLGGWVPCALARCACGRLGSAPLGR